MLPALLLALSSAHDSAWFACAISDSAYAHDVKAYHLPKRYPVWLRLRDGRIIGGTTTDKRKHVHADGHIDTVPAPRSWGR